MTRPMTRTILIATVAALAITAPAQAQRPDRDAERAAKAEARKAARAEQAPAPQKQAKQAPAQQQQQRVRAERPQREQRVQPQREQRVQPQREQRVQPQREQRVHAQQPQRVQVQREQRVRMERPQREQRVQVQRPQREQRVRTERPQREQRVQAQRPQREQRVQVQRQRVERTARIQNRVERRNVVERQARRTESLSQRNVQQRPLNQDRQAQRVARTQDRFERRSTQLDMRAHQRTRIADIREQRQINRTAAIGKRLNDFDRQSFVPLTQTVNSTVNQDWYGDYAAQRYRSLYGNTPNYYYDYNYDDGYLYQVNRNNNLVTALFPLLGGAFGVGQQLPYGYDNYNVPYGYRSLYYDTPDYYYRYGDGGIYQVDSSSQLVTAVVALLTGQNLGIGQRLPMGYDAYNVPYQYRDAYYDTNDAWYRYDDGYIYQVDPYSRMIEQMYPVSYGGYAVGYPAPAYAGYGGYGGYSGYSDYGGYGGYNAYSVPYGYQSSYYAEPGYNYQYSNGGIYQVDPSTQLVRALVALVTGTNLGVGQMLPNGYDAYNVPYEYRSAYYDTPDAMYRYDDGTIYQADPRTRIIQSAYPLSYGVYPVGYAIPSYASYDVPDSYDGLYYPQPDYDYRYANGGIYAVDPNSLQVQSVAALLTGQTLGVGQMLPMGYDAYNVPYAYRERYYDTANSWYRYNDGYIYQVDPQTRVIRAVIDAIV